jgi:hypothetical protein
VFGQCKEQGQATVRTLTQLIAKRSVLGPRPGPLYPPSELVKLRGRDV